MRFPSYVYRLLLWNAKRLCGQEVKKTAPSLDLDSRLYRLIYNAKRKLGIYGTDPWPIVWREPIREYEPPVNWKESLGEEQKDRLNHLCKELKVLTRIYTFLPKTLKEKDWQILINLDSAKQLFQHLHFLRQKENRRAKDEEKKSAKKSSSRIDAEEVEAISIMEDAEFVNEVEASSVPEDVKENEDEMKTTAIRMPSKKQQERERYTTALRLNDRPKLVVDCRFLGLHSSRGLNLTLSQVQNVIGLNIRRQQPWPVYLANFDVENREVMEAKEKHLTGVDSNQLKAELSADSYLDMFPDQQKLVYLSPHAEQELEQVESDACYIIGGIVDRVKEPKIHPEASRIVAEAEGVVCRKFPLDQHLNWKRGNKLLTLTSVVAILQDVYDSNGDWERAFARHIPVRKLRPAEDVNQSVKQKRDRLRKYDKEIVRILVENTQR